MTAARTYHHHTATGDELAIEYHAGPDIEIIRAINGAGNEVALSQDEHDAVMWRIGEIELDHAAARGLRTNAADKPIGELA